MAVRFTEVFIPISRFPFALRSLARPLARIVKSRQDLPKLLIPLAHPDPATCSARRIADARLAPWYDRCPAFETGGKAPSADKVFATLECRLVGRLQGKL